jgi:hypothetical protein
MSLKVYTNQPNRSPKSASYYSLGGSSTFFLGYSFFLGSSFFSYFLGASFFSAGLAAEEAVLPNRFCPSAMI